MDKALVIRDLRTSTTADFFEISAEVDGNRVFYRASSQYDIDCQGRGDPFLGVGLLEAMIRKVDIWIEDSMPISKKLYDKLPELQSIYTCWNSSLQKINVHSRVEEFKDQYESVGCYWSAGVDSSHTLSRNIEEITHLIMLGGFEVGGNTPEFWRKSIERQRAFAQSIGKILLPLQTNAKQWIEERKIEWPFAQGLVLASIGPLLKCKKVYIGSSHTYSELFPWGSHPLTDPMWSTESTELIHFGAGFRRSEKMLDLRKNHLILDNLQVCWRNPHTNCGECTKCIRTMTALYLLKMSSKALPRLDDIRKLQIFLKVVDESGATFLEDMMILARNTQNETIFRIIRKAYRRYQMRELIKMLDRYIIGGVIRRLYIRFGKPEWLGTRVSLRGPQPPWGSKLLR